MTFVVVGRNEGRYCMYVCSFLGTGRGDEMVLED